MSGENGNFVHNIVKVTVSNGMVLLASLLANFFLPNIMEMSEYGIYKEFTLYFSYCGLLHLGFVDGLYICYGGKKYETINKTELKIYTTFFYLFQGTILVLAGIFSIFLKSDLQFFLFSLGIMAVANNITTFYQYLSQATERFNELMIRNIIKSVLQIIAIGVLLMLVNFGYIDSVSARLYIIVLMFITILLTFWYETTYKCFSISALKSLKDSKSRIQNIFKCGFPLLLAGSISNLILISDRQFAVIYASKEEYALYAFAYSIATLLITMVSAVSIVLFPTIKKVDENNIGRSYKRSLGFLLIFAFFFGSFYSIIEKVILWFVPKYCESTVYLFILMPAMLINMAIVAINTNFYKALNLNKKYLRLSIIILIIAIILNAGFLLRDKSLRGLSVASVLTFIVWFAFSSVDIGKKVKVNVMPYLSYMIIMVIVFYCSFGSTEGIFGTILYLVSWVIISFFFSKKFFQWKKLERGKI